MPFLRARSSTYVIAAFLAILTLYTLASLSRPTRHTVDPWHADRPESEKVIHGEHAAEVSAHPDNLRPTTVQKSPNPDHTPEHTPDPTPESENHEDAVDRKPPTGESIDDLIKDADQRFKSLEDKQSFTMSDAAEAYRKRRGMHPPPGWNLWFDYARENDAIIVEEFWDQIYHDLNPFWAIDPATIRAQARKLGMTVEIKDGKVESTADWFWHKIWGRMIGTIADRLPDMLIALNPMDESRLLVGREVMDKHMAKYFRARKLVDPKRVVSNVTGWLKEEEPYGPTIPDFKWIEQDTYRYVWQACAKDSPAHRFSGVLTAERIMAEHERAEPKLNVEQYFGGRFVVNYTEATDACTDPSIGGVHGALMNPYTTRVLEQLLPLFGGSKFHVNNEILLPAPMPWSGQGPYGSRSRDQDSTPWSNKMDKVVWRGTATGGVVEPYTWFLYHRHRFVAMTNGTRYSNASRHHDPIFTPFFRESAISHLKQPIQDRFGDWLKATHDTGFIQIPCNHEPDGKQTCWYLSDEFKRIKSIPFSRQWKYKYVPDIDGNSYSGRFRAFLLSNSLPIKATIYREWHDSRLIPWYHFVPMNNRFSDYYAILHYFIGDDDVQGHDEAAEKIATQGKQWSERVLRKEDMQIYTLRLLLEYARLTDKNRTKLGWVEDLLANPSANNK